MGTGEAKAAAEGGVSLVLGGLNCTAAALPTVSRRVRDVLLHEAAEAREVGGHTRNPHHSAFA